MRIAPAQSCNITESVTGQQERDGHTTAEKTLRQV